MNTEMRDENTFRLRWKWKRPMQELGRSVFVIPAEELKRNCPDVAILNDVAAKVLDSCRSIHGEYVLTYRDKRKLLPDRTATINNNG